MRLNQRHRTAIRRTTLSRPLSLALDAGLIDHDVIVLDYGCGRGADYPLRAKFTRLTQQEERWGLYEVPVSIGTKRKWNQLLAEKGVRLSGHRLTRVAHHS
jgi:hypothetical protein